MTYQWFSEGVGENLGQVLDPLPFATLCQQL